MKSCTSCGQSRPLSEFSENKRSSDGYRHWCKPCFNAYSKVYREENRARLQAHKKADWSKNRERYQASKRLYYERRKDFVKENVARWKVANREATRDYWHRRKAVLKGVGGSHTREQVLQLAVQQNYRCNARGCDISGGWDRDHIVPISKGGTNDIGNIQLLCARCNAQKHDKDWSVFLNEIAG